MTTTDSPITDTATSAGSGGCGCGGCRCGDAATKATTSSAGATQTSHRVTGLTCGHCVKAITEQLLALPAVTSVHIDLVPDGVSTVALAATQPLAREDIADALQQAGDYTLQ